MEQKKEFKAVTAYQASVKFEGKWYNSETSKNLSDVMDFIMRARQKTHAKNMPCNIMEVIVYEAAQ
jgi:hypothetical protein